MTKTERDLLIAIGDVLYGLGGSPAAHRDLGETLNTIKDTIKDIKPADKVLNPNNPKVGDVFYYCNERREILSYDKDLQTYSIGSWVNRDGDGKRSIQTYDLNQFKSPQITLE